MEIKPIAYFRSPFPEKFGIPRQAGLAPALRGRIVFEPEYRSADALRGLDGAPDAEAEASVFRADDLHGRTARPYRACGRISCAKTVGRAVSLNQ